MKSYSNHTNATIARDDVILPSMLLGFLTIGAVFGNGLVCMAFHKVRILRTVTNYFIVSLAVADLLVGFVSMPLWFTSVAFHWPIATPPSAVYILWICMDIASATASIMNLAVISIDRYYAITSPLLYKTHLTKRRACFYIMIVWVYALGVASIRATPLFGLWYSYFIATASFFVPLPIMCFCYVRIFRVALKHATKLRKLEGLIEHVQRFDERDLLTSDRKTQLTTNSNHIVKQRLSFKSEMKAAKTLAIVMGAFILCWAPYIITLVIDVSCSDCIPHTRLKVLAQVVKWLHYSNSLLNPVIYAMLNRGFREAFIRVLCKHPSRVCKNKSTLLHFKEGRHDNECEMFECVEKISVV